MKIHFLWRAGMHSIVLPLLPFGCELIFLSPFFLFSIYFFFCFILIVAFWLCLLETETPLILNVAFVLKFIRLLMILGRAPMFPLSCARARARARLFG